MHLNCYQQEGIKFVEIINDKDLKLVLCDLGASIFQIYFHGEPMTRNVENVKDFKLPNCYYGKTIGRTANRLRGHVFEIDGEKYDFEYNEGENTLHGGRSGFSNQYFNQEVEQKDDFVEVTYTYLSKHLESGYPGNIKFEVKYIIYKKEDRFDVKYNAISDQNTYFSLTNHAYFTLGDEDISEHQFFVRGHQYLKVNLDDLLPIEPRPVDEVMDFSKFKKITTNIESESLKGKKMAGYDNYFYFDKRDINLVNCSLKNNRYQLDVLTDFEGTQLYTSNYNPGFKLNTSAYNRDSSAIEPSDSFLKLPLLKKDEVYKREIRYIFKKL